MSVLNFILLSQFVISWPLLIPIARKSNWISQKRASQPGNFLQLDVSTDVNHCDFSKLIFSTIYFNTLDRNKALPLFTTRFWSSAFKGFDFSHVIYFFHKSFWEVSKGFDEGGQAGRERLKPWVTDSHSFKQLEHS